MRQPIAVSGRRQRSIATSRAVASDRCSSRPACPSLPSNRIFKSTERSLQSFGLSEPLLVAVEREELLGTNHQGSGCVEDVEAAVPACQGVCGRKPLGLIDHCSLIACRLCASLAYRANKKLVSTHVTIVRWLLE